MNLRAVAQRVIEVAEIEVSAVIDLAASHPEERLAARLHRDIERDLLQAIKVRQDPRGKRLTLKTVHADLSNVLNSRSIKLLSQALRAFRKGMAADVLYVVNEGGSAVEGEGEGEEFAFDASQMPFIRYHGDALSAAIRLREIAPSLQWLALRLATLIDELKQAEWTTAHEPPTQVLLRTSRIRGGIQLVQSQLPSNVAADVREFVSSMEFGSVHPYALPIATSPDASPSDVRLIADMYAKFGSELRQFVTGTLSGNALQCLQAQSAWLTYQALGRCFKVVAGWMGALALEDEQRICSICYRHVAALSRCAEHATSSHETREGRLGKRVRPRYLAHTANLARSENVRSSLAASLRPFWDGGPDMELAAIAEGVPGRLIGRALVLGGQLQRLFFVFPPSRREQVQDIFIKLVRTAVRLTGKPSGRTREELRKERATSELAYEMLSLKGFFFFWYGNGWIKPFGDEIPRLGCDRNHPALHGALDPYVLAGHLLRQRGWEEAFKEFVGELMPDRDDIRALQREGMTIAGIADRYNLPHQSIRYSMEQPRSARKRIRLSR